MDEDVRERFHDHGDELQRLVLWRAVTENEIIHMKTNASEIKEEVKAQTVILTSLKGDVKIMLGWFALAGTVALIIVEIGMKVIFK